MKTKLSLCWIVAMFVVVNSYTQIVALHSSSGVQIIKGNAALTTAYTAAENGDTLYLSGHAFTLPATFDKQLMIFGTGHYVDSTMATGKTFLTGNVTLSENADFFYLEGVEITGKFIIATNHSVNNATIKRCKINGTFEALGNASNPTKNLSLIGNVFLQRLTIENLQNALITNNIIVNTLQYTNGNLINNNIVMGYIWGSSMDYLLIGSNNIFNNNIFIWDGYNANVNGSGNVFNYNLYVEPTPNHGTASTAIGNYTGISQSDIFVNQTGVAFDYTHDYHLQSPTIYIGTDSTQVGIYGGVFPYKAGGVPSNPHIQMQNIAPSTSNGLLNVQINAAAQDE